MWCEVFGSYFACYQFYPVLRMSLQKKRVSSLHNRLGIFHLYWHYKFLIEVQRHCERNFRAFRLEAGYQFRFYNFCFARKFMDQIMYEKVIAKNVPIKFMKNENFKQTGKWRWVLRIINSSSDPRTIQTQFSLSPSTVLSTLFNIIQ